MRGMLMKVGRLTKEKEREIAHAAAEAFMSEEGSFPSSFTFREAEAYFRAVISMCAKAGKLYTTSPREEGYIAFWRRRKGPGLFLSLRFCLQLFEGIRTEKMSAYADKLKNWKDYEEQFRKEKDYVNVFMVFVRREYQGQGFLKKLLAEPFRTAGEYGIPCILDTDAELKERKYVSAGMRRVKTGTLPDGTKMFTMVYRETGKDGQNEIV